MDGTWIAPLFYSDVLNELEGVAGIMRALGEADLRTTNADPARILSTLGFWVEDRAGRLFAAKDTADWLKRPTITVHPHDSSEKASA